VKHIGASPHPTLRGCAECLRLRHELAAIDVEVQSYMDVAGREPPMVVRRQAVRTCSAIGRRLEQLQNYESTRGLTPPAPASSSSRRSSLSTLFEFRGRKWLLFPLSWALLFLAAALTWYLLKR
jgi:hypothetical protein